MTTHRIIQGFAFKHNLKTSFENFRCPIDETTFIMESSKVGVSRFMTEGFKFIADHPFVFVHCHIRICDAGNSNSRCAQGCVEELRKRRDVSSEDKLYPLAQGPLTISSDTTERKSEATSRAKGRYTFTSGVLTFWKKH